MPRYEYRPCTCDNGYTGPYGDACARCEGNLQYEVLVAEEGDCRRCCGLGKVAWMMRLVECQACKGTGYELDED